MKQAYCLIALLLLILMALNAYHSAHTGWCMEGFDTASPPQTDCTSCDYAVKIMQEVQDDMKQVTAGIASCKKQAASNQQAAKKLASSMKKQSGTGGTKASGIGTKH